jgi:hypothetical protein
MTTDSTVEGWHFTGPTLRDGRPLPADGEWLEHAGPLVMCESGLHMSELLTALSTESAGGGRRGADARVRDRART